MKLNKRKIPAAVLLIVMLFQTIACGTQKMAMKDKLKDGVTILGLGDSITEGSADFFSYLFPLDSLLLAHHYHVKFIGPRRSGQGNDSIQHFGWGGKTAEFIAKQIDSIYNLYPADIILFHSGHNHFVEEAPVPSIIAAQKKVLKTIRRINPSAIIFVAAVITSGKLPKYEYIPQLNDSIKAMVAEMNDPRIVFVDQAKGWDWEKYTINDKVHPNSEGAKHIAETWFRAITDLSIKK